MCLELFLAASIHMGLQGDYQNIHPHVQCEVEHSILNSTIAVSYTHLTLPTIYSV